MEDLGKFKRRVEQNILPDLRDNFGQEYPPGMVVRELSSPEASLPMADRLMAPETREAILSETEVMADGEYKATMMVGKKEEATLHPHDFFIRKEDGVVRVYFVDPEHAMGKHKRQDNSPLIRKGDIRPASVALLAAELAKDTVPRLSMLWYRSQAIDELPDLKMRAQYGVARQLLENDTELPDLLRGKGNEITFRFITRPNLMIAQGRYTDQAELKSFMQGQHDVNGPLEGKVSAANIIMRHALRLLREDAFKPTTEKSSGSLEQPTDSQEVS